MAYENKDMEGSLFKNKDKQPGDSRPNAKGVVMIKGVMYRVSAWTNKTRDGEPYQKLKYELLDAEKPNAPSPDKRPAYQDLDDEIPWN